LDYPITKLLTDTLSLLDQQFKSEGTLLEQAAQCIEQYAFKKLSNVRLCNPFFADHGYGHSRRMAAFLNNYFRIVCHNSLSKPELLADAQTCQQFFLMLWSSILLHDVGMAEIDSANGAPDYVNIIPIWLEQRARKKHVGKSVSIIKAFKNNSDNKKFSAWNSYWQAANINIGVIWDTVADIVASHGDESQDWLNFDKNLKKTLVGRTIDMDKFKSYYEIGGAFLCLADMCDIGPDRVSKMLNETTQDNWADVWDQMKPDLRESSCIHFIANEISKLSIQYSEEKIIVRITIEGKDSEPGRSLNSFVRYYLFINNQNPVDTALQWGNMKVMKDKLQNYYFGGIRLEQESSATQVWKKELELLCSKHLVKISEEEQKLWQYVPEWPEHNGATDKPPCIMYRWHRASKLLNFHTDENKFSIIQRVLIRLIEEKKLPMEFLTKPEGYDHKSHYFCIQSVPSQAWKFLIAIKFAEELLDKQIQAFFSEMPSKNEQSDSPKIHICTKSLRLFSVVAKSEIAENNKDIYILQVSGGSDSVEKIVSGLKQKSFKGYIIFISETETDLSISENVKSNVKIIKDTYCSNINMTPVLNIINTMLNKDQQLSSEAINTLSTNFDGFLEKWQYHYDKSAYLRGKITECCETENGESCDTEKIRGVIFLNIFHFYEKFLENGRELSLKETFLNKKYNNFVGKILFEIKTLFKMDNQNKKIDFEASKKYCMSNGFIKEKNGILADCNLAEVLKPCYIYGELKNNKTDFLCVLIQSTLIYDMEIKLINYYSKLVMRYVILLPEKILSFIIDEKEDVKKRASVAIKSVMTIFEHWDDYSQYLNDYLSELLGIDNNTDTYGGMIIFQVIYRLWTTIFEKGDKWISENSQIIKALDTNYGQNPVYRLGQFEAICSKGDDVISSTIDKLKICKTVIMKNFDNKTNNTLVQMWFDTLICYREKEINHESPLYRELYSICSEIQESITIADKWEKVAMSFHSRNNVAYIATNDSLYKSWREMREMFQKVVNSLPKEYSRTLNEESKP